MGMDEIKEQLRIPETEIIVLDNQSAKKNSSIPLRRFAGEGSDHNTLIKPGTSLFVDLDEYEAIGCTLVRMGQQRCLIRSLCGLDERLVEKGNEIH